MYEFYLFSLITSLVLLVLWQTLGKSKVLRRFFGTLFLFGIILYAFALFQLHLRDFYSLKIVFRDLMILSFASFVSIMARRSKVGIASWLLLAGFLTFMISKNKDILVPRDFNLDQSAELFLKLNSPAGTTGSVELQEFLASENIIYKQAFSVNDADDTELDNYLTLDLQDDSELYISKLIKDLNAFDEVTFIEENEEIHIAPLETLTASKQIETEFTDPLATQQWALNILKVRELSNLISSSDARKKAKLFILDTGVDAKHEDLQGNYLSHRAKYDTDIQSHGTHCAGIAGAMSNNSKGVASMSINNSLFTISSIKVLSDSGMGTQKKIVAGIIEAADNGADVISLSLGGRSTDRRQRVYEETVAYANRKGAIVVVAAGNSSMNARGYSPANTKGVIAVAAIDENLNIAPFSNTVEDLEMGIAAPGVNILSTIPNDGYKAFNGTSMATPYVAGLISIMKSLNPELTTEEIYSLLDINGQYAVQSSKSGNLIDPYKTIKNLVGK